MYDYLMRHDRSMCMTMVNIIPFANEWWFLDAAYAYQHGAVDGTVRVACSPALLRLNRTVEREIGLGLAVVETLSRCPLLRTPLLSAASAASGAETAETAETDAGTEESGGSGAEVMSDTV